MMPMPAVRAVACVALVGAVFAGVGACAWDGRQRPPQVVAQRQPDTLRTVVRVVDGDTIVLDGNETVRLIGLDAPESKHPRRPVERFAHESSRFTRQLLEGKQVTLEFDRQRIDRYGRTLAYVSLAGGVLVNEEIIRQGYGHVYVKYRFAQPMMDRLRAAERDARAARRGLWASELAPGSRVPREELK